MSQAEDIGPLADALNDQIKRAEEVIYDIGFKVCASVPLTDNSGRSLSWGKYKGEWLLVLETGGEYGELLKATIHDRCAAVPLIPDLMKALDVARSEVGRNIANQTEKLRLFLDELEGKEQAP